MISTKGVARGLLRCEGKIYMFRQPDLAGFLMYSAQMKSPGRGWVVSDLAG